VIPEDWECTNVSGIASPIRNATVGGPFGSDLVSNDYVEQGVPVIRGQNMGFKLVSGNFVFVTPAKASSLKSNLAHAGDLVFTQRGTLGQVSLVPDRPFDHYLISQSQMKLTVNREKANPAFFYYVFRSCEQQQFIRQSTIQTGVPHINLGILRSIPVQRPRLAEQEAIAEALSDADALIESLERLIAKKRKIKHGAMQELLTGRKRLPGFHGEWLEKTLADLGESLIGLTYKPSDVKSNGLLVLRASNIFQEALRFDDNVFVNIDVPAAIILRKGDILICVRNGSRDLIGKCALINEEAQGMTFGAFMAVFRTPFYDLVYHQFQSDLIKRQINEHLGATINQITNKSLNSFQIPFPTDERERAAITEILSDMDAEIVAAEGKLTKARQLKHGMMQELLTGRTRLV
jgi:type I restriction enzyme, S subunit